MFSKSEGEPIDQALESAKLQLWYPHDASKGEMHQMIKEHLDTWGSEHLLVNPRSRPYEWRDERNNGKQTLAFLRPGLPNLTVAFALQFMSFFLSPITKKGGFISIMRLVTGLPIGQTVKTRQLVTRWPIFPPSLARSTMSTNRPVPTAKVPFRDQPDADTKRHLLQLIHASSKTRNVLLNCEGYLGHLRPALSLAKDFLTYDPKVLVTLSVVTYWAHDEAGQLRLEARRRFDLFFETYRKFLSQCIISST